MNDLDRIFEGVGLLRPYAVKGTIEQLVYPGIGVETAIIPEDTSTCHRLRSLGWSWSSDVEDDHLNQLWTYVSTPSINGKGAGR